MITNDGVLLPEVDNNEQFYGEVVGWCHQCWQLYALGNTIDLTEFKRRLNVDNIDYQQFMIDYADKLDLQPTGDKLYVQRVIDALAGN
jgi:hypothetical protein